VSVRYFGSNKIGKKYMTLFQYLAVRLSFLSDLSKYSYVELLGVYLHLAINKFAKIVSAVGFPLFRKQENTPRIRIYKYTL